MDDHADHTRSYNVSGKVMLTAIISLSFVVVFVTFLHIYVRYVFRRQVRRRTTLWQQGLHTTAHEPPKSGLDPTIIGSLPTFLFKQDQKARTIECAVCLSNLEDGEMVKILPNCKHSFHVTCIDTWLSKNSTCPVCRTAAEPQQVVVEPVEITEPTVPPLDQVSCIEGTSDGSGKVLGSSSRLSSFRKMLGKDRSSNRIHEDHMERQ